MKKIIFVLIASVALYSCGGGNSEATSAEMADFESVAPAPPALMCSSEKSMRSSSEPIDNKEVNKKKIIKDGRLGLQVNDLDATKQKIDALIKKQGGYSTNENFQNADWESSYNLIIRIPCDNFEKFISDVESGNGEILYKEVVARDVTDQFIDLETRLKNKRNYLNRYNEILEKAKSIEEILQIEEKIRGLEEEIESTTGRLQYLNDLVDYSTLNLTITKKKEYEYKPDVRDKFSEKFKHSVSKGWYGFVDFTLLMIKIWPFWIIVVAIIFTWRFFKKKKKKNQLNS